MTQMAARTRCPLRYVARETATSLQRMGECTSACLAAQRNPCRIYENRAKKARPEKQARRHTLLKAFSPWFREPKCRQYPQSQPGLATGSASFCKSKSMSAIKTWTGAHGRRRAPSSSGYVERARETIGRGGTHVSRRYFSGRSGRFSTSSEGGFCTKGRCGRA